MIEAVLFAAVVLGLVHPAFIKNRRAFGVGVILVVTDLVAEAILVGSSYIWSSTLVEAIRQGTLASPRDLIFIATALAPLIRVAAGIAILRAYWPGGGLLSIQSEERQPPA